MQQSRDGCLLRSAAVSDAAGDGARSLHKGPNATGPRFAAAVLAAMLGCSALAAQQPRRPQVPQMRPRPAMPASPSGPWAQVLAAHAQLREAIAHLVNAPAGSTVAFQLSSNGHLSAIVTAPQQGDQGGPAPIGMALTGPVDGSRPLRAARLFLGRAPDGRAVLQLRGQGGSILWQGVSQTAPESPGSTARPVYIPRIICYETLALSGGPLSFTPASEEGEVPTEVTCVDLGWMQATGSMRTVGTWTVAHAAVASGPTLSVTPGGEFHAVVQSLLQADQAALGAAVAEPGIGQPVAISAASIGTVWNGVAGLLPGGAPGPSTMRQSTASPGLLSLIQGRTVLTRILMRPGGCATQGILFQPNGQPLPPEEGGECTISQGASSGNQPLLFLTHTGTVVGEPQGTWITIKCCSVTTCEAEHYKGCHCCAQY